MTGLVLRFDAGPLLQHLDRLERLDASGYDSVRRDIGSYMVDDARSNIREQRLFDGSTMLPAKSAEAHSFYRKGQSGKSKGKLRKVSVKARHTMLDTKRLSDSFVYDDTGKDLVIGSAVEYAAIQHFGGKTSAHMILARPGSALRTPYGLFKSVYHPGSQIPARPVLGVGSRQSLQIGYLIEEVLRRLQ